MVKIQKVVIARKNVKRKVAHKDTINIRSVIKNIAKYWKY